MCMDFNAAGGRGALANAHLSSCEFFERLSLGSWGAVCTFFGSLSPYSSSRKTTTSSRIKKSRVEKG